MSLLFAICLLLAAARHPPALHHQKILWIAAHPDDEALVAPLLVTADSPALLVFTRGEHGLCYLPGGCSDLGAVRAAEMARAAGLLHAHLTLWTLSDTGTDVEATWSAEAGGRAELIRRIESVIAAEKPTVIYTFDPNHGSTCHTAHLAAGALAREGAAESGVPVVFVETLVEFAGNDFLFRPATGDAVTFDASRTWDALVADAETHASQFSPEQIESLRNTPAAQRRVWLSTAPAQTNSCGR